MYAIASGDDYAPIAAALVLRGGQLGADPQNRMLYIGYASAEQVWIMLYPNDQLHGGESAPINPGPFSSDTVLSVQDYLSLKLFLAYCMAKALLCDVICDEAHPPLSDSEKDHLTSNIQ